MTHPGGRSDHRVGAWRLNGSVIAVLLLGVAIRLLSPAIFLDIVSLWPIAVVLVALGWVVQRIWAGSRLTAAPILPLLVFSWLVFSASFYFAGLPNLPSHSANLRGPPVDQSDFSTLAVEMKTGRLLLSRGDGPSAYRVNVIRRGGSAGVPVAVEIRGENGGEVSIVDARVPLPLDLNSMVKDNAWLRFAGWQVGLHPQTFWNLTLSSPDLSADLRQLQVVGLVANGGGTIKVGEPTGPMEILINGVFIIEVPDQAPVEVTGVAVVPEDWMVEDDMAWFGERGTGWHIEISEGGSAQIITGTQ